jgi:hypothetical protein
MEDNVYDLSAWRARLRPTALPPQVRTEMALADRLGDALAAQGYELRFDAPGDGRPVRAHLRSVDGDAVRVVSLLEAVGAHDPWGPEAA